MRVHVASLLVCRLLQEHQVPLCLPQHLAVLERRGSLGLPAYRHLPWVPVDLGVQAALEDLALLSALVGPLLQRVLAAQEGPTWDVSR